MRGGGGGGLGGGPQAGPPQAGTGGGAAGFWRSQNGLRPDWRRGVRPAENRKPGAAGFGVFRRNLPILGENLRVLDESCGNFYLCKGVTTLPFSPSLAIIPKNAPVFSFILSVCSYFFANSLLFFMVNNSTILIKKELITKTLEDNSRSIHQSLFYL